jgi:hypothetical protein
MITALGLLVLLIQSQAGQEVKKTAPSESTTLEARLHTRVTNYQLDANNFVDALLQVAGDHKVPMGIEWVRTPVTMHNVRMSWKSASVKDVIEAIVKTQPGYTMTTEAGVVHVYALGLVPDRENFLKLRVTEFEVRDEVVEVAERRLVSLVNATVSPPKPMARVTGGGGIGNSLAVEVGDPNLALKMKDVTVEDVLDALALASPKKVWIVTFAPAGQLMPTGFRQMASPIGDDGPAKPYWELLKWGRKPY